MKSFTNIGRKITIRYFNSYNSKYKSSYDHKLEIEKINREIERLDQKIVLASLITLMGALWFK